MLAAKFVELRDAGHGAVFVHDFADDGGGVQPGDAREIDAGFGLTGADEYAAVAGAQRKDVAGTSQILRRVFGSMAVRMVMARSEALMPVVTPRRPSMASMKAVPWTEVLIGDISGR